MVPLSESPAFRALGEHHRAHASAHLRDLFAADKARFESFSVGLGDLLFDYSKHRMTAETMELLVALAEERGVRASMEAMFAGRA